MNPLNWKWTNLLGYISLAYSNILSIKFFYVLSLRLQ